METERQRLNTFPAKYIQQPKYAMDKLFLSTDFYNHQLCTNVRWFRLLFHSIIIYSTKKGRGLTKGQLQNNKLHSYTGCNNTSERNIQCLKPSLEKNSWTHLLGLTSPTRASPQVKFFIPSCHEID